MISKTLLATPRNQLLLLTAIGSLFCLGLLYARIYATGAEQYLFLRWNLFLAVLPLVISSMLLKIEAGRKGILATILIGLWLAFFPNAPYILTDLFHLRPRQGVPLWFDLALLLSFAGNGLLMGFLSLRDVQVVIEKWFGRAVGWLASFGSLALASFGIYLGRYLRWNSWDVLVEPQLLLADIADRLIDPFAHPRTYGVTILFTVLLAIAYLTMVQLSRVNSR